MTFDVFISYSSKDQVVANAACARLESAGIRCWIAPRDIGAGRDWGEAIIEAIECCQVMVLVFSENANQSHQIKREIERATSKGLPVLPMRIEEVLPSRSLEYFIGSVHWLDALTQPLEQHLDRLADAIKLLLPGGVSADRSSTHLDQAPQLSPPPASPRRIWRYAALAVPILVAIGAAFWFFRPQIGPTDRVSQTSHPTPAGTLGDQPVSATEALSGGEAASAKKNYGEALQWYRKAADLGNADAQDRIGYLYEHGLGVSQDFTEAMTWYRKAAEQGQATAQNNIGTLYEKGLGVSKDYTQAVIWFRKSADQGNAFAQTSIGWLYQNGWGVNRDYDQAMVWYRKAADQGNAAAESNIAGLYFNGSGVPQDYAQALAWTRKAADRGFPVAESKLGLLYQKGLGVDQDYTQAMTWYRRAADKGNADAQYELGELYEHGQGVPLNLDESRQWMEKAAASGSDNAKAWLAKH